MPASVRLQPRDASVEFCRAGEHQARVRTGHVWLGEKFPLGINHGDVCEITVLAAAPDVSHTSVGSAFASFQMCFAKAKTWIPGEGRHENRLRDGPEPARWTNRTDRLRPLPHLLFLGFCNRISVLFSSLVVVSSLRSPAACAESGVSPKSRYFPHPCCRPADVLLERTTSLFLFYGGKKRGLREQLG